MMGSCGVPDICAPSHGPVEVRPDIVGIGILVSFLLSAGAALSTVILGYLLDLLPGDHLSWADWGFLQTFHLRKCCRARYRGADNNNPNENLKPCRHADPLVDEKYRKCLVAFLLAMSDQQLVTGPAMIFAALSQHCTITAYEFNVVNSLGWLANTTHLATLLVLRQYFQQNKAMRNIRVIAMLANLCLLIYTTRLTSLSHAFDDNSVSIQCAMERPSIDSTSYSTLLGTIWLSILSHSEIISKLYVENHRPSSFWLSIYCCYVTTPQLTEEQFDLWYLQNVWLSEYRPRTEAQRSYAWRRATAFHKPDERTSFPLQQFRRWWAVAADFRVSFLQEILILLLSTAYALTKVITSRLNAPKVKNSENTVDFGQIVPLFLLALPILAVVEIVYEARSEHESPEKPSKSHHQPAQNHSPNPAPPAAHPSPIELTTFSHPTANPIWLTTTTTTIHHPSHYLSTGLARLDTQPLSTALDPRLLYPYSSPTYRHPLILLFFTLAALATASGVLIPLSSTVSVALIIIWLLGFWSRVGERVYYMYKTWIAVRRLDRLRYGDANFAVKIPGGLPAPPSSPLLTGNDPADDGGLHEGRRVAEPQPLDDDGGALGGSSPERAVTDSDDIIHALPSPVRRRTTGFEGEDEGEEAGAGVERRPVRVNTVSEMV